VDISQAAESGSHMSNPFEGLDKPDPQAKTSAKPKGSQTLLFGLLVGAPHLLRRRYRRIFRVLTERRAALAVDVCSC
jgi:hypothetical protein